MPLQYEGANGQGNRSGCVVLWKYFLIIVIDLIYLVGPVGFKTAIAGAKSAWITMAQQNLNQGATAGFKLGQIPLSKFPNSPFITYLCRP